MKNADQSLWALWGKLTLTENHYNDWAFYLVRDRPGHPKNWDVDSLDF